MLDLRAQLKSLGGERDVVGLGAQGVGLAAELLGEGTFNVMVAYRNGECVPVPLQEVVGRRKLVPADHPLVLCARKVGTCFGD